MDPSTELAPTNLIALRDGKQRAEALISTRFAEGLIDQDELDRRLEAVNDAGTLPALERIIVDLVDPGTTASAALAVPSAAGATAALARPEDVAPERKITALFGTIEERGRWVPARHNRVIDVFAEVTLDLREAVLGPGETEFEITCVFAHAIVLVPPGLAVRVDATVIMASVERDPEIPMHPQAPNEPVVVITGMAFAAAIELTERLPGERPRDARRRHRAQRRALRRARKAQGALPPGGR